MARPKKLEPIKIKEIAVEEVVEEELPAVEEVANEEVANEEVAEVELPETKDVFIFTNSDTGNHHVFDTKEEAESFKSDKNGVIRLGIFNNKHNNIDVIRG